MRLLASLGGIPSIRPWLLHGAILLWTLVTAPFALHMATEGQRTWALLALLAGPIAMLLRRRPYLAAAALIVGATVLRLSFVGLSTSDPIALSQAAAERAFAGQDPYGGFVYDTGSPYSYGPLGLITYQLGIPGELAATIGTSLVLLWARAWMTVAFYNAWPQFLYTPVIGDNDYSAGFVLLLSLVALRQKPVLGAALLAAAGAIKPYAAAWFLPAVGFAGLQATAVLAGTSVILWSPVLLVWGLPSYLSSVVRTDALRDYIATLFPSWSFADIPILRLLVIPFSLAGLVVRSWTAMALLGAAGFIAFLGFSPWAHVAYLAAVVPVIGLALEWRPESRRIAGTATGAPGSRRGPRDHRANRLMPDHQ